MSKSKLVLGTRGSALALIQAGWVKSRLEARRPGLTVELSLIKTKGDRILDAPLAKVGGKGLFVKEIEDALLAGRVDLAVHSMKDVPVQLPPGLTIACVPEREDWRDVLVTGRGGHLDGLRRGARVGTSSLRRRAQLLHRRPDLEIVPLRGNLDTRLRKLAEEGLDAIVVAAAGLWRMNLQDRADQFLGPDLMVPAIGQGALGLEVRADDARVLELVSFLDHGPSRVAVAAERAYLETMEGGCQVPLGALATLEDGRLDLIALVADPDGVRYYSGRITAEPARAAQAGRELALELLARGGREILAEFYQKEGL
ncbi:MAG: hydroxymethylbilane synthase [Thermodesulfobacteriota bacterium]